MRRLLLILASSFVLGGTQVSAIDVSPEQEQLLLMYEQDVADFIKYDKTEKTYIWILHKKDSEWLTNYSKNQEASNETHYNEWLNTIKDSSKVLLDLFGKGYTLKINNANDINNAFIILKDGEIIENNINNTSPSTKNNNSVSQEFKNALRKAESYFSMMSMSKMGIYDQLTSDYGENFPPEAAQYAIDNLDVDYKQAALKKAKSYYEQMSMSKDAVYDQLVSDSGEQFTPEEAQYAIDNLE